MISDKVSCPICSQDNFALPPAVKEGESYPLLSCPHQLWNPALFPDLMTFCLEYCFIHSSNIDIGKLEPQRQALEAIAKRHLQEKDGWLFKKSTDDTQEMCKELREFLNNCGLLEQERVKSEEELPEELKVYMLRERRLAQKGAESERYLVNWQRALADFTNYKRRVEQEQSNLTKFVNAALMSSLLPVLDDLERALAAVSAKLAGLTWVDGIRLIQRKLQAILEAQGLSEIQAIGQDFDPNLHEAVMYGDGEEGKVIEELQRGYKLHDRVIRPSMVKVGKEKKQEGLEQPESKEE